MYNGQQRLWACPEFNVGHCWSEVESPIFTNTMTLLSTMILTIISSDKFSHYNRLSSHLNFFSDADVIVVDIIVDSLDESWHSHK